MRFLADENIMVEIVAGLRQAGHDVNAIAEVTPSATDTDVLSMAAVDAIETNLERLSGNFLVIEANRIRSRAL